MSKHFKNGKKVSSYQFKIPPPASSSQEVVQLQIALLLSSIELTFNRIGA